jgi:plasmid maintenance system antidote protein VapI
VFIDNRKQAIKTKLKVFDLSQENLAVILGHKSKTHMSELINGIKPFTLKDLIVINRILKIDMKVLVPNFLSIEDQEKVRIAVQSLNKPKVKLSTKDLVFA